MKKIIFMRDKKWLPFILLVLCLNSWNISEAKTTLSDNDNGFSGNWEDHDEGERSLTIIPISFFYNSQHLTIQDSNPVNTITVKITSNETGTTVFENVYPQGQTSFIVIPMDGWSAGSYTIELFGRENNGYLWGTFQVLP